jgi:hypothetical protein
MDILFFLRQRTKFVRQFYDIAALPFEEKKRKIEAEQEPYVPPYSEDGEPPFLEEWIQVNESLDVLGHSCISMLSASLQLYLKTWDTKLGLRCDSAHKREFNKSGWINAYRVCFREQVGIKWEEGPADLHVLEEVVLARNRVQHPERITTNRITYSKSDAKKLPRIFFVDDTDIKIISLTGGIENSWIIAPTLRVTREKLYTVITELEKFCIWLNERIEEKDLSR